MTVPFKIVAKYKGADQQQSWARGKPGTLRTLILLVDVFSYYPLDAR